MKKTLLSLGLAALSLGAFAQTNSELSGNDLNTDKDGYVYSFLAPGNGNDVGVANCTDDANIWNAFGANVFTYAMNAAGGLEITIPSGTDASASNLRIGAIRMSSGNCSILQTGSYLDLSSNQKIEVRGSSDSDIDLIIMVASDDAGWKTHDGAFAAQSFTSTVNVGTYTAADADFNGSGDLTQVVGWELWLPSGTPVLSSDIVVTINAMAFGESDLPPGVGIFDAAQKASFEVFPNPANTDLVNFSKDLNNVSVMNALGSVVFEASSAKNLNVSSFETGMYILKSDEGSTKLIIE